MENKMEFRKANDAFVEKYDEVIKKLATYNKVDMSTGAEMFKTNLDESLKGHKAPYAGGGVIATAEWNEMIKAYGNLKEIAKKNL